MKVHFILTRAHIFLIVCGTCLCASDRPFKLDLTDGRTFELSEEISSDDENDILYPDDEMIPVSGLLRANLMADEQKHYRIHQVAIRRNRKMVENETDKAIGSGHKFNETNVYDYSDAEPFVGEYIDGDGGNKTERELYKFDQMMKRMVKHNNANNSLEEDDYNDPDYDYGRYKAEYEMDERRVAESNATYNYTDVKEEETMGDALKTMTDFKRPKNCTKEEMSGIGISAARCFLQDLRAKEAPLQKKSLLRRLVTYLLIWIGLYVAIAIPCWCQNGLCCCCCPCKSCRPNECIDEVRKFAADNPAGVYNVDGVKHEYKPSVFEKYAQKNLEKHILKI